jgi:hypothetical protein
MSHTKSMRQHMADAEPGVSCQQRADSNDPTTLKGVVSQFEFALVESAKSQESRWASGFRKIFAVQLVRFAAAPDRNRSRPVSVALKF